MEYVVALFLVLFASVIPFVSAEVWIPEDEFRGYFDLNNIYTVVGVVRNTESYPVLPTVEIIINDDGKLIPITQQLPAVSPSKDIPFKLKVSTVSHNVVLEKPNITFEKSNKPLPNVEVIYDRTLVRHEDGHQSGRIINNGNKTAYNLKVYATIHGPGNKVIDVGKNIEKIEKIEPGEILEFTIYPDPSIASHVNYYSCFAIGDETIIPLFAIRDSEKFNFRYDSTASFTVVGFDESGTKLTLDGINSFKVPTYVNFEFPKTTENEKFDVLVNGKETRFIQSMDEFGNWHVAFDVEGASQNRIVIGGFANQKPSASLLEEITDQKTDQNVDYGFLYYVVAAVAITAAGISVYKFRANKKITRSS
jgi:hypothetical protein